MVQVFAGSPASADLQRGDQILAIQNREASFLSHQEANDIIRGAGGSLMLSIRRFIISEYKIYFQCF